MKLILITAINEFEKDVIEILRKSGVKSFSYQNVNGYINTMETDIENWFGSAHEEVDSLLFTVFVEKDKVDDIYKKIEEFNSKQESLSQVHIASLTIEKSI